MSTWQIPHFDAGYTLLKYRNNKTLTCFSSNWSPPKAATQGLIPPVPRAIRLRPINDKILKWRGKDAITVWIPNQLQRWTIKDNIIFACLHMPCGCFLLALTPSIAHENLLSSHLASARNCIVWEDPMHDNSIHLLYVCFKWKKILVETWKLIH